ncbi:hypothetical protein [uncultured Bradyrhizobium sp.]|uniref:hypothetical protein n=1 Tax=uncultured Bradyrhizobium sp. TaxID=199684 RepID=UPI0035CA5113
MGLGLALAIAALIGAAGKFIDDFYVPDEQKNTIAAKLSVAFERVDKIRIPDVPIRMASWFFQKDSDERFIQRTIGPFSLFYVLLLLFYFGISSQRTWLGLLLAFCGSFVISFVSVVFAYLPARWMYIQLSTSSWRVLNWLSIPLSVFLPLWLLPKLIRYLNSSAPGPIAMEIIAVLIIFAALPFLMVSFFIALAYLAKIAVSSVNFVSKHLLHKSYESKKPFTYAGACLGLLIAIGKVVDEALKAFA